MKKSWILSLLILGKVITAAAEHISTNIYTPTSTTATDEDEATAVIDPLRIVVCDPSELQRYLKEVAIEDERRATEKLDRSLRSTYHFDNKKKFIEADLPVLLDAAVLGLRTIRDRFKTRWTTIKSELGTNPNEYMKALAPALQPHVEAVVTEYDLQIKQLELRKEDSETREFTGIACAACNVGYQPLAAGLKKNQLSRGNNRDKSKCPKGPIFNGIALEYNEKTYTIMIGTPSGNVTLVDKISGNERELSIPKELPVLKAIDQYYKENAHKFTGVPQSQNALIVALSNGLSQIEQRQLLDPEVLLKKLLDELAEKKTQGEKFEHAIKRLAEFENLPGLGPLRDLMDQLMANPSKAAVRQKIIEEFGIPVKAIIKSNKVNNRWSKGYTVDYSKFEGGPPRNNGLDNPVRKRVLESLRGPSGDANHVLLYLTGACFYCDAALWLQLQFP